MRDLRQLVMLCRDRDVSKPRSLVTSVYRQQYELLRQEVSGATMRLRNHQADFRRHRPLFRDGVVAASEFEEHRISVEHASIELVLLSSTKGLCWQQDMDGVTTTRSAPAVNEQEVGEYKEI